MKIALNELKLLVRKEIRKTLKENVDLEKMKEFRQNLETEFNEWAEKSSSYGTGYGIVEYLKNYLQDYANKNNLQLTDAYSDLDRVIDYDSKQDPDSEFGEPGNISGTFNVGDGASGEFSSYGDGYDFDASIEINDDFWPFKPLHSGNAGAAAQIKQERSGTNLQEVMNFLFESCEEVNYGKSDEYLDKNFHTDLKNKLEKIFITKPGNNSWDGGRDAVQVQLSNFLVDIAKEHKLRFPGGTKLYNIITVFTEEEDIEYHTEFTHNIEMEEKIIATWTTAANQGGGNHKFISYKIDEKKLNQVSPPFLRFESPDGAYWDSDVIDPCSEEGEEKLR